MLLMKKANYKYDCNTYSASDIFTVWKSDSNGEFEPIVVLKNKRDTSGIEEKVMSLYLRGMSARGINNQIKDIYGIELSAEMVSKITDSLMPQIKEWQNRPLEPIYPFVFMDVIHYRVREDSQIKNKTAYMVLGVLNDLKNR